MHVTDQSYLVGLSDKVRQIAIRDAKGTWNVSSLLGPPSVEFAPYGRIPSNKRRNDARQGTIDQDSEFIAFLEELTNPIPAKKSIDDEKKECGDKKEEITITPLVQFLKAKKAAKGKKPAPTGAKKSDVNVAEKKTVDTREVSMSPRKITQRGKVESTVKEVKEVKEIKQVTRDSPGSPRKSKVIPSSKPAIPADTKTITASPTPPRGPAADRKRERGNVSAAARILQRDLGLGGDALARRRGHAPENSTSSHTGGQTPAANTTAVKSGGGATNEKSSEQAGTSVSGKATESNTSSTEEKKTSSISKEVTQSPQTRANNASPVVVLKKDTSAVQVPTGPAASRTPRKNVVPPSKGSSPAVRSKTSSSSTSGQQQDASSANASTQAFLKHANPSQGITEPVLKQAMEAFGEVTKAEIDKKKGFAYVDFAQPEGLQKALQASPVKIAEGQVVVLERKDRGVTTGNVRGGGVNRGGRGGANHGPGSGSSRGGGGRGGRGGRGGFTPRGGTGVTTSRPSPQPTATSVESTGGTGSAE